MILRRQPTEEEAAANNGKALPGQPSGDTENAPEDEKNAGGGTPSSMGQLVKAAQDNNNNKGADDSYVELPDPPSKIPKARGGDHGAFMAAEMMLCGTTFHESGTRELVRVGTQDSRDVFYHPPQAAAAEDPEIMSAAAVLYFNEEPADEFEKRLAEIYPLNKVLLAGCAVWAISFLFDPNVGGFRMYANGWNVLGFIVAALVGPLMAFPMRQATLKRRPNRKKKVRWALMATLFLVTVLSIADPMVENYHVWYILVIGFLFIVASYPILQRSRRMGIRWDMKGKPKSTSEVIVQNIGTPLLFWGAMLFWVGTNAVPMADLNQTYLPVWTTLSRSWCVFIAGMLLILPAHMALDFAFDQGSQPIVVSETLISVYKLDGSSFTKLLAELKWVPESFIATVLESPIWLSLGWTLMALTCFLPFGVTELTVQQFCAMAICAAIPMVYGVFVLPALWKGDFAGFTKWTFTYYGLMILWATSIGIGGGIALLLSIVGVFFVLVGHRWDLYERKRGISWLHTTMEGETSKSDFIQAHPQVFGIGQPLYVVGWVLLCLGMSIPM
ncbi:MAG: hypothetical protein SGILL_000997 [Bacillariaceae sp.]